MYLASEHKSVRLEAVKTCTALLVPALLPTTIFTQPFVQFSQTSASVVADVLKKLLSVGITDTGLSVVCLSVFLSVVCLSACLPMPVCISYCMYNLQMMRSDSVYWCLWMRGLTHIWLKLKISLLYL